MSLAFSLERYTRLGSVTSAFLTSQAPSHSEELRVCGKTCHIPLPDTDLDSTLFPLDKSLAYLVDFAGQFPNPDWDKIPWSSGFKPDLFKIVEVLIPFTDDLPFRVDKRYYPEDLVEQKMDLLSASVGVLDIPKQLLVIKAAPETLIWDSHLLSLALRVFSRNRDQSTGATTNISEAEAVLKRLPVFPEWELQATSDESKLIANCSGDWYHFWSCIVLGALFEKHRNEVNMNNPIYRLKFLAYDTLFSNSASLSLLGRGKKNKCGLHEAADKIGFYTGRRLAQQSSLNNSTF